MSECVAMSVALDPRLPASREAAVLLFAEFNEDNAVDVPYDQQISDYLRYHCPLGTQLYALVDRTTNQVVSAASVAHGLHGQKTEIYEITTRADKRQSGCCTTLLGAIACVAQARGDIMVGLTPRREAIAYYRNRGFAGPDNENGMRAWVADLVERHYKGNLVAEAELV